MSTAPAPSVSDYLSFSQLAYDLTNSVPPSIPFPTNWTELSALSSNGLEVAAFINSSTHQIVIAFRGSEFGTATDDQSDLDIGSGITPAAFPAAQAFAANIISNNPGFTYYVTGHSLGGAEAEYVAAEVPNIAGGVTFAAPGIANLLTSVPAATLANLPKTLTNYLISTDPLGNNAGSGAQVAHVVPLSPVEYLSNVMVAALSGGVAPLAYGALLIATSHSLSTYGQALADPNAVDAEAAIFVLFSNNVRAQPWVK
jgi:hypothetical protein